MSAAHALPGRTVSLRTVLVASLLLFSLLPAATVGWFLYRSNLQDAHLLAENMVEGVAQRARQGAEDYLAQAHVVMNGLIHEQPNAASVLRARQFFEHPQRFEQAAFAMTRMTPAVTNIYMGSYRGEWLGIESFPQEAGSLVRVSERRRADSGRHFYAAGYPGDRRQPLPVEEVSYEPRSRPWYQKSLALKGRAFTPAEALAFDRQLHLTLGQPVYGDDGGALGVFAIDLPLKPLATLLQGMRISPRGAVFLVDEQGLLLASSTGDELLSGQAEPLQRHDPSQSRNPLLQRAFQEVQPSLGKTLESSVQRIGFSRRVVLGDDMLLVSLKPFGESQGVRWSLVVVAPESDFTGAARAALTKALGAAALVLLLGALLAVALAYALGGHFRRLSQAAGQLARQALPTLPRPSRIAEVNQLSQALHDSARELQASRVALEAQHEALRQANDTLEARVASRTAALSASREEALSSARAKAAFLAAMSHEIRTPLNGVVGMTTLLADTALDAEQRDYVHTMRISSDQLLGVINDILDFSKIESGKLELENEPLNLLGAIEEACDISAPRAREKGLELLVDLGDELPGWVRGDVTRLRQVLLNLVNNAVKFTEHGQVIVSAHMLEQYTPGQGALVEFRIKDTGIGIPEERQAALFESFVQVDASTTRKYGGSGLGLAICKRLAGLMGGRVGLQSAPGQGSTFWFTARLGQADAPEVAMLSALHMVSLAGKRALVLDDTVLNLRILDKQLRRWGIEPVLFEHAAQALAWLAQHPVDVVITDMHMPGMDGQDFASAVRHDTPDTPIVLLTSGTMPSGDKARVFDARLLKPYRQTQLFEALARVTSASQAVENVAKAPAAARDQFILVADDNAINLKVALAMLAKLGYEAATAVNGREAVDLVAASLRTGTGDKPRPYDAILMDANMPVMDGFVASRLILSTHGAVAPPIIALTASVLEEDRQRCIDAGMVGFLPKPLRIDELSEALARYTSRKNTKVAPETGAASADGTCAGGINGTKTSLPLMDWSRLEDFREFDDEELSMTREVTALFVRERPQRLSDLGSALAACDSAVLSRAAHALKGAASNIGAQALSQGCGALEQSCLKGRWPADAAAQVAAIGELAGQTCQALQDWAATAL